jgi:polyhydroxybutyrate depolymerase
MRFAAILAFAFLIAPAQAASIQVNGQIRTYTLDRVSVRAPLVVALHGGGGSGQQFRRSSGLGRAGNAAGFAVVFPGGLAHQWNDGRTTPGGVPVHGAEDMAFILALAKKLVADGVADRNRIYVTGISNGGMMALRLSCEAPKTFAGIAAVSANLPEGLPCGGTSNSAFLNIVGSVDPMVPPAGGPVAGKARQGSVISAAETFRVFLARSGCKGTKPLPVIDAIPDDGTAVAGKAGRGCRARTEQLVIEGGGHAWPGGLGGSVIFDTGPETREINATVTVLGFFKGP